MNIVLFGNPLTITPPRFGVKRKVCTNKKQLQELKAIFPAINTDKDAVYYATTMEELKEHIFHANRYRNNQQLQRNKPNSRFRYPKNKGYIFFKPSDTLSNELRAVECGAAREALSKELLIYAKSSKPVYLEGQYITYRPLDFNA